MFGDRVIVPEMFRRRILQQFHRGHSGMVRMKAIARSFVFWPGIDNDIEDFVKHCTPCLLAAKTPTKTTLESWPIPAKPWSRIHIDYAGPVDGVYFLIIVDPFSKWPEIHPTKSTTTKTTIKLLIQTFATFGNPEVIVSDNGTQFSSHEFQDFCTAQGIRHIRIAPYHPQSNGLAERFVDTLKRSLRKMRTGGESLEEALYTFLNVYRSTPTSDLNGKAPAELMFGRPIRTISSLLKPTERSTDSTFRNRKNQNNSFNKKHGAVKRAFQHGDTVYVKVHRANSWQWQPATVIEKIGTVNYNVFLEDQHRLIRSHANQLNARVPEPSTVGNPTPLSVFFDGFGLTAPKALNVPVDNPDPQLLEEPVLDESNEASLTNDSSEDEVVGNEESVPVQSSTPILERGRRMIQLPARFKPYWMMKP
ncbi:uncharacterized protein K02A2.6-like [Malaya genurostris]|uniref:uncharacterized protein K02A2.6-like n=1 Tax=Malaya genurostris TaxID=325434 RepID=UPI0026F3ADEA|nr:uncharacterized protein K02A2.6-like [Malaya genurostris]